MFRRLRSLILFDPEVLNGDGDVSAVVDGVVPRRP